ncbi:uncharacterized protein N7477_003681 [Penicillium maclennaniae]|uniref:uncharacterized protein n=1 Tax=Penicillium maclennaniae TaxID=1343394 RepID=UPI00253FED9C|nr:uncharacterized protein N7477_003681 [Penicillium maclennaniae]KAJ5678048.1 hypothetical protein N7477_003681 [Penicillium maclennaniae]
MTKPMLQTGPGSAVIRVLAANVLTYSGQINMGSRPYPYPTPFTRGCSAVGRDLSVGPDAATLQPGQLVFFDLFIRGRDNSELCILSGVFHSLDAARKKLMAAIGTTAVAGESSRGRSWLPAVKFGGLRDVDVRAGETVVIVPRTGVFGGAPVLAALAMGAQVIAMGPNQEVWKEVEALGSNGRTRTLCNSGDDEKDIQN